MNDTVERAAYRLWELLRRAASSYVVVIVLALLVGLQIAPAAWSLGIESETEGTVAVIPLEGGINGQTAAGVSAQFQRARNDPSIDAVVLLVNSPGGGAAASETLYMQIDQTSKEMPVVTSVSAIAASGGYFALAPTDYVYTHPSAFVGSIGTLGILPGELEPIDIVLTTGPNKLRGGDERDWQYAISGAQNAFLNAVVENRNLTVPEEEVATGQLWTGAEAVRLGLADETGGLEAATRRAANEADLDSYDVTFLRPDGPAQFVTRAAYSASNASEKELVSPVQFTGRFDQPRAAPVILMMPGTVVQAAIERSTNRSVRVTNRTEVDDVTAAG